MEYVIAGLCILAIIVIVVVQKKHCSSSDLVQKNNSIGGISSHTKENLTIPFEMLPADTIAETSALTEITDPKVLAHIDHLIPGLVQAGVAADTAIHVAQTGGEVLYRAILPAGAKLANSKDMAGAVRGFYHGPDGIQGHANLVATDPTGGISVAANAAAAAMGVASMIVGQYYMTQINTELSKIGDDISKISDFQNNEFRSRVFALVSHVKKISAFQTEILENQELRLSKITQLDSLEEECTKLLGQANLSLADAAKKTDLDFDSYEKEVQTAQSWHLYQQTLLAVLYQLSDLKFALHMGTVSREQCTALLPTYTHQSEETQIRLSTWHQETAKRLGINAADSIRKRTGFDKAVHYLPGRFDDRKNFKAISEGTSKMIKQQLSGIAIPQHQNSDLYAEDVQLISMNGKLYYLQDKSEEG